MEDYIYNGTVFPDNSSTVFGTSVTTLTAEFGTTIFKSTDSPQYTSEASTLLTTSELSSSVNPSDDIEFVFDSLPQRAFIAAVILLASTIGIFGNSLVILAVLASRKLRTVTNVFVFNLAVADLLVSLTLPWNAIALIAVDGWPLPQHLCSAVAGILFVSVGCSVYTLASIAVNRWVVITQSRKVSQRLFRPKLLCIWITLTWLIPFIGTIIPPLVGFGKLGYNTKYGSCSNVSKNPKSDEYDILSAMIIYPIPLAIIVVAYVKTFLHVRKHSVKLAKYQAKRKDRFESCSSIGHSEDFTSYSEKNHKISYEMDETITSRVSNTSKSNGCNEHDTPSGKSTKEQLKENTPEQTYIPQTNTKPTSRSSSVRATIMKRFSKDRIRKMTIRPRLSHRELIITKNMFYIVVVFLVCLSPFAFCLFIDSSDPAIPYAAAMVFFNSCLNPIVYATKHPYFKKVFGLIIKCKLRDIPEPSGCLKTMLNTCCGSEMTYV